MAHNDPSDDIAADLKEQSDIVQIIGEVVDLRRSGARYLGLCPFHGEKTPSFSVHPGHQFYYCFGCGATGDVFSFIMKHQGLSFPEALENLARRYGVTLPARTQWKKAAALNDKKKDLFQLLEKSAELYSRCLADPGQGKAARRYLAQRGIGPELAGRFGLGYAPAPEMAGWNFLGNQLSRSQIEAAIEVGLLAKKEQGGSYDRFRDRILFPIYTIAGQVCGFGGRILGDGQPKYMNSPESLVYDKSRQLLGLYQNREQIRKSNRAVIVEGNFDMLSLVANGCGNVVAPLGTALTREQLRLLKRTTEEAILLFDGDEAGIKAASRSVPLFLAEQLSGKVAVLPKGHDPDTFVRTEGLPALVKLLDEAKSLPEFFLGNLIQTYGEGLDGKRRIVEELQPLVAAAGSGLQRKVFIAHFAERLAMPAEQLESYLGEVQEKAVQKREPPRAVREDGVTPLSLAQKQLLEYVIFHPQSYKELAETGLQEYLEGTLGEILCLELKRLLGMRETLEPEELLTQLPEGSERAFVAHLLAHPPPVLEQEEEVDELLAEHLHYLRMVKMKREDLALQKEIDAAEREGDQELLQKLLLSKIEMNRRFHEENP